MGDRMMPTEGVDTGVERDYRITVTKAPKDTAFHRDMVVVGKCLLQLTATGESATLRVMVEQPFQT
jgi:hypothetical protein